MTKVFTMAFAAGMLTLMSPARTSAIDVATPWNGNSSLSVTQSSSFRYQVKDFDSVRYDDNLWMWLNKLNLQFNSDPVRAGVRVDSNWMGAESSCDASFGGTCPIRSEHGFERGFPEKVFLSWSSENTALTLGDFYTSWGQGLVLNLKKVDELGVDTTLRGGRIGLKAGTMQVEGIAGRTNVQNLEMFRGSYEVIEDPDDFLAGLQATSNIGEGVEVGLRAVHTVFETPETLNHDESQTLAGGSVEMARLGKWGALYVEGAVSHLRDLDKGQGLTRTDHGSALYARLNGFFGPVTVLLEGKRYRKFEFVTRNAGISLKTPVFYHLAPTLERYDQQVFNNTDTTGVRTKLDWSLRKTKTRLFANGMWNVYAPVLGMDPWSPDSRGAYHVYGGARQKLGGGVSIEASGGWREERQRGGDQDLYRKLWHAEGEIGMPLQGPQGIVLKSEFRNEVKNSAFSRMLTTVTYSVSQALSVSALLGYTTERIEIEPVHHAAGQVDVGLGSWGNLRLFGGSVPGGIVCAGGTCVYVPSAMSYRADVVARF